MVNIVLLKRTALTTCAIQVCFALSSCGGSSGSGDGFLASQPVFAEVADVENIVLDDGREIQAAKDEILIYLKEDVAQQEYDEIIQYLKDENLRVVAFNEDLRTLQVNVGANVSELDFIDSVKLLKGVNSSGLNQAIRFSDKSNNARGYNKYLENSTPMALSSPDAKKSAVKASLRADIPTFDGDYWVNHIDLSVAWDIEDALPSLSDVTIGVVDTGIPSNQSIIEESRLTRYDQNGLVISDDNSFGEIGDLENHGLWSTAFAAGYFDESRTTSFDDISRGVSRKSDVIHVDVYERQCSTILDCFFGGGTFTTDLLTGLTTAIQRGADVVNISWQDLSKCSYSQAQRLASRQKFNDEMNNAVAFAKREDRLLVFAAGNNCEKQDNQLLPLANDLDADAWQTHAVIVGATNSAKTDAFFSRMGSVVDLTAPGEDVGYGKDDFLAIWDDDGITDGTSFSAPIVTGVAAILKGINGTLAAAEIKHILVDTAEPTVTFADAASERYRGYIGENATAPNLLVNAGSAARSAELTRDVELETLTAVELRLGESNDIDVNFTLPETSVTSLDAVFLIDVSSSYADDIDTLQANAANIIRDLNESGLDVQYGVASFADFPISDYGNAAAGDEAYYLQQTITSDEAAIAEAIDSLDKPLREGGDPPESQLEALYQLATGSGRDINNDGDFLDRGELAPQDIGWRTGALRVVFFATDAAFHNAENELGYPGIGKADAISALQGAGIQVVGLQSGDSVATFLDISSVVNATNGSIHTLSSDSSEISQAVLDGLDAALARVDISIDQISGSEWISSVTPLSFTGLTPGSERQFKVSLFGQKSSSIDELNYDIYLWVRADGSALLKRIKIPIVVPIDG